ncbi:hypothetical protein llap_6170 [Limosa lapponica baueri]|uniref:Uncharacterized protein n=1 Tax=Limosa lapponica baueri TaxID=1758121 RepID=A0A2I0UC32_LIMLA|nr:hypothetical protein llap_6170 [Limosa lapponica baueri]
MKRRLQMRSEKRWGVDEAERYWKAAPDGKRLCGGTERKLVLNERREEVRETNASIAIGEEMSLLVEILYINLMFKTSEDEEVLQPKYLTQYVFEEAEVIGYSKVGKEDKN